jgi:hypothetical protein
MRAFLVALALCLWGGSAVAGTCQGTIAPGPWTTCVDTGVEAGHLTLSSEGGMLRVALEEALAIADNQVAIEVVGPCWSACIWLLAASPDVRLGAKASISVHFIYSHLGDNRVLVRAQETRAAWRLLTGRDDLWNTYVAYVRDQHVVQADWNGGDFTTYGVTKGGSFVQRSFLQLSTAQLHQVGLLSGRSPRIPPIKVPFDRPCRPLGCPHIEGHHTAGHTMIGPYRLERPLLDKEATLGALCTALGLPVPTKAHVTLAWSAAPVDWDLPVFDADAYPLSLTPIHPTLALFGAGDLAVLTFQHAGLQRRHADLVAAGASWDHNPYHPHVTLGRFTGPLPDVDASLLPHTLHFGPEHRRDL